MYKVKTLNNISDSCKDVLTSADYIVGDDVQRPDAIFVRASDMHGYPFNKELKCIGRAGIGVNTIPLDECSEKGIVVFNTPGGNANGVKELFLFAMSMAGRDIFNAMKWVYTYDDSEGPVEARMEKIKKQFAGPEYAGKTLGVIGTGNVGSAVANIALSLGMKVYGYDPYLSVDAAWRISRHVFRVSSLDDLLKYSDFITLHVPLKGDTRHLINREAIAKMKNGVRIINYARDAVVDEDAIIEGLESGKVAKFVSDFPTRRLINTENVVLTPHLGGTTYESEANCARMAAMEIDDYLRYGNIKNSVNMPTVILERSGKARICLIHKNLPGVLAAITAVLSEDGINIENMTNKSLGDYAYSLFDVNSEVDEHNIRELNEVKGMVRVRIIKWDE
ncbi:MAG: phosphoglycerate dehydrogenase [Erysipelotrichaceae bacterium]|nr:phosphoglycerate dehydrogenase [Erysipelotrichaceae bacterium]